jgi:probable rRNA maturation factor
VINQIDIIYELDEEIYIGTSLLKDILSSLTNQNIELVITDNRTIADLNKTYRGKDRATDVLSFPLEHEFGHIIGSVVISADFVRDKSKELGHSFEEELALLFTHGVLHLLGYDHETDNGEHRAAEEQVISKFNLPSSLIVRNQIQT